ncbi:MAG: hypothetical protein R3323_04525 [Wenzhouxiangellaceae bacterium]|nr:hypothetical protein [Wenzhouxiangellaceae bacterium]
MLRWLIGVLFLLALAAGVLLGVLNPEPVVLDLAVLQWTTALGSIVTVALAVGLAAGLLLGLLLAGSGRRRRSRETTSVPASHPGRPDA